MDRARKAIQNIGSIEAFLLIVHHLLLRDNSSNGPSFPCIRLDAKNTSVCQAHIAFPVNCPHKNLQADYVEVGQ